MKTIYVKKEPRGSPKKYSATLPNGKRVRFGQRGYSDYTIHKDPQRMKRYLNRHRAREDWSPRGVGTPGFWSRWFLWSHPDVSGAARMASKASGMRVVLV